MGRNLTVLLGIAGTYAASWLGPINGSAGCMPGSPASIASAVVPLCVHKSLRRKHA